MKPLTLSKHKDGGFQVTAEGIDTDRLAPDEALGVLAHAIFGDGSEHKFLRPVKEPVREAPPVDTLVEAYRSATGNWLKRYSTGELDKQGRLIVFSNGANSITADGRTYEYEQWRLIEPVEDKDGWIEHIPTATSVCPVPKGTKMQVRLRNGYEITTVAITGGCSSQIQWRTGTLDDPNEKATPQDIVAYRLSK